MEQMRPVVIRGEQGEPPPGPPTPGMDRRQLFAQDDRWAGWVRTDPGVAGGWHHHGDCDSYIYMLRGAITIEYGPGGREQVTVGAGDFIFNPRGMVHREITAPGEAAELFVLRVGPGPQNINVDGPDPESPGAPTWPTA
jgi:uncharacterized RmlC-like cupin family protein